jgi:iron(III) transport system permease protein
MSDVRSAGATTFRLPPLTRREERLLRLPRPSGPAWAVGGLIALVGFLVLYPLGMLLYGSLLSSRPGLPGVLTLANYVSAYSSADTYKLFLTTGLVMGLKTIAATALASLMAWIVARTDTPLRGLLEALIVLPFFVPGILEAIGWIMLLSPKAGTLNVLFRDVLGTQTTFNIYSLGGMVWVMALGSVSFIFLFVLSAFRNMDGSLEEAARASGAGPVRVALQVTAPLLAPAILGAAMLSFIRAMESFEVPVLIGIPAKVMVFTSRIYAAVQYDYPTNYGLATALGVSFVALSAGLLWLERRLLRNRSFAVVSGKGFRPQLVRLGPFKYLTFALCLGYFVVASALPLSQLVLGSVSRTFGLWDPATLSLDNYARMFTDDQLWRSLKNTLGLGVATAAVAMLLCAAVAYTLVRTRVAGRGLLRFVAWLPWTVPGLVVGLGMAWAYIRFPIPIYGTVFLLGIAFLTGAIPLGVQLMSGVMVQLGTDLEESARTCGATWPAMFGRVLLPLVKPALTAGAIILFVTFARALSSVVLLSGPGTELLSVMMFKYFNAGRVETVCALAVVMLVINASGLLLVRRLGFSGATTSSSS